jgi:hypothetical protein
MHSCERCRDMLWDHLYDLLDTADSEMVQSHLQDCAECREELARVQVHQGWLAQASRLDVEIPPFAPPDSDQAYAVLPGALHSPNWVRSMLPYVAVAAAVLLCLGLPAGLYWRARSNHLALSAQVEEKVAKLLQEREAVLRDQPHAEEALKTSMKSRFVRLELEGPVGYRPGGSSTYRVKATDLEGKPFPAVAVRVLDSAQKVLLAHNRLPEKGPLVLTLPATLDFGSHRVGRLEVAAMDGAAEGILTTPLRITPSAIAYLTIDRKTYNAGDAVYFSIHIRDRFALGDPDRIYQPAITIRHGQEAPVAELRAFSSQVGIAGGSWKLPATAETGEYTVTVADPQGRFEPASRTFLVGRADAFQVESKPAVQASVITDRRPGFPEIKISKRVLEPREDLEVKLIGFSPGRQLLLRLLCRGSVACEETLTTATDNKTVVLHRPVDAAGLAHLLVFEEADDQRGLWADRLVYLRPQQALRLAAKSDRSRYRGDDEVSIRLESKNEKGLAEVSWLQVSIVETNAIPSAPSLPADCYLVSELGRSQSSSGEFDSLLAETPAARAALEKFLRDQDRHGAGKIPQTQPVDAIVRLDNFGPVEKKFKDSLAIALANVRAGAEAKMESLTAETKSALEEIRKDWQQLEMPRMISLGILSGALMLAVAGFFIAIVGRKGKLAAPRRAYLIFGSGLAGFFAVAAIINIAGNPSSDSGRTDLLARLQTSIHLPALAAAETELPAKIPFIGVIQATGGRGVSLPPPQNVGLPSGPTLVWAPAVFAENGSAQVTFKIPVKPASYRVLVEGHSGSGRMGACEATIRSE